MKFISGRGHCDIRWLQIPLKHGGADTEITQDDVDEYLQLVATYHVKYHANCDTAPAPLAPLD